MYVTVVEFDKSAPPPLPLMPLLLLSFLFVAGLYKRDYLLLVCYHPMNSE